MNRKIKVTKTKSKNEQLGIIDLKLGLFRSYSNRPNCKPY